MTNPCFACMSMANQLFLVGYMGAGKTTAANALSLRTGLPMMYLDEELERREGRSIAALFDQDGETAFRTKESDLLLQIAGNAALPIVACGGGIMGNSTNVRTMQTHGHVVWIDPPFEVILERLRALVKDADHARHVETLDAANAHYAAVVARLARGLARHQRVGFL